MTEKADETDASHDRRLDYACIGGVGAGLLLLYFLCACRTVFVGDSGELAAVAATYGIPHPSGYPLYALAAGTWVRIFAFGSEAFAANTFSGLCSAAALAVLTGFLLDLLRDRPGRRAAAVGTALLVGLSTAWWQESTVARVYHLNSLCSIALFWSAWRAGRTATTGRMLLTGALAGLALANHLAAVGVVAGSAVMWVIVRVRAHRERGDGAAGLGAWAGREWPLAAWGSAAVIPGLLLYLWLPFRYAQEPMARWKPIVTLGDLANYVLRGDYAGRSWTDGSLIRTLHALAHGVWVVAAELTPIGIGLIVAGALCWRREPARRPLLIGAAVWIVVFSVLFVTHGQRRDIFLWDRYWLPAILAAAVVAGIGWPLLLERIPKWPARWAAVGVVPLILLGWNWKRCDRSGHTLALDVSRRILERVKPDSFVVASGDNVGFPVLYLLATRELRPKGVRPYFPGMRPDVEMRLPPAAVRAGHVVWTHPPDWGEDGRMQVDVVGLLAVARMRDQPPWRPDPWDSWAVPAAENAPPRDQVYESHERELLSHYFRMKGRALARVDAAAAEAALQRAEHYAHGNELSMLDLRDALHQLGRTDWANRLHQETLAFAPKAVRDHAPRAEPPSGDGPFGGPPPPPPPGPGPGPGR
ncbi:MAG: protein O-mannosyl-transferase family [Planctomycetota bacterium]